MEITPLSVGFLFFLKGNQTKSTNVSSDQFLDLVRDWVFNLRLYLDVSREINLSYLDPQTLGYINILSEIGLDITYWALFDAEYLLTNANYHIFNSINRISK